MTHSIRQLDAHMINQIAAGEVIEGPFSVVKELMENAIDARATIIQVEIQQGGKRCIVVTDNGTGIPGDEIEIAFKSHTTSKLRTIDDLQHLHTLGFRGEALASIAAVSRVEITTKQQSRISGYRAIFESGQMTSMEETGCPDGTRIIVRDLFYQTPARLKFMKSDGAESARISELITRLALSRPDIAFQYINNNNITLTTRGENGLSPAVLSIFPEEIGRNMFETAQKTYFLENYRLSISGLLCQPHASRGNRQYQFYYVNGRSVRSEVLTQGLEQAYEGALMVNRFPLCVLYIDITPELLDVNVHPSKVAIKFQYPQWIVESLGDYVKQALQTQTTMVHSEPSRTYGLAHTHAYGKSLSGEQFHLQNLQRRSDKIETTNKALSESQREQNDESLNLKTDFMPDREKRDAFKPDNRVVQTSAQFEVRQTEVHYTASHTNVIPPTSPINPALQSQQQFLDEVLTNRQYHLLGQAFKTYIMLESGEYLYLIDQHAAHERIMYESLLSEARQQGVAIQELMEGPIIDLSISEMDWVMAHNSKFKQMGFILELFGHQSVRITGVPYQMGLPAEINFLKSLIDEFMREEWQHHPLPLEKLIRHACRLAIKAHDSLNRMEMTALLDQMIRLPIPLTCPHGRPIVLKMRDYDLEKLFKRV
ncbi:DNA mismatch repair endonuclease MutL [Anoxynatronum sibiricum]|uniref:DNA mismatch repair protein MutL n=1 Tax=Anoxynatronum sibiricum TaxID=210623 RepID=A0ABU9VQ90_9CLOT